MGISSSHHVSRTSLNNEHISYFITHKVMQFGFTNCRNKKVFLKTFKKDWCTLFFFFARLIELLQKFEFVLKKSMQTQLPQVLGMNRHRSH